MVPIVAKSQADTHPVNVCPEVTEIEARLAVKTLLAYIGEDFTREGLQDTPRRVIKALEEMTEGYGINPAAILSTDFAGGSYDQMIIIRDYPFVSMCEHHMLPFFGVATVGYIPGKDKRVVGLSKLGRLVDCFARRLQIQEQMTEQIAEQLQLHLKPKGVGVRLTASHSCMSCRGVNKTAQMVTTALRGVFYEGSVRAEFLAH